MTHGSSVTTSVQSSSRHVPSAAAASRSASTSAWAVGSWRCSRSLWRRATTAPSRSTDGPDRDVAVRPSAACGLHQRERHRLLVAVHGGGSGIRTHGGLPHTRFPSVPIRPLSHPSGTGTSRGRLPAEVGRRRGRPGSMAPHPPGEATVGSRATGVRETGQGREAAAFSGAACVPRIAWPSPQPAGGCVSAGRRRAGGLVRPGAGRRWSPPPRRSARSARTTASRRPCRPGRRSSMVAMRRNSTARSSWLCSVDDSLAAPAQPRDLPLAGGGRDVLEMAVHGQHRGRALRAPPGQAGEAVGRVAHQRQVVRDRRRGHAELRLRRRAASYTSPLRRSSCTTRWPTTHCPRSLSGVQMITCSTRSSAAATAAAAPEGVVGLELDHGPRGHAHGDERVLEHGRLVQELGRHALARLVARPQVVAEALDHVVGRHADVRGRPPAAAGGSTTARRSWPRRGRGPRGGRPARSAGGTARRCRRRGGPSSPQPARPHSGPSSADGRRRHAGRAAGPAQPSASQGYRAVSCAA